MQGVEELGAWVEGGGRRIQRAVLMHGTSEYRQRAAQLMAQLLQDAGATGVAYGWTDQLNPGVLAPVHVVARSPIDEWRVWGIGGASRAIDHLGPFRWQLVLRGVPEAQLDQLRPRMAFIRGFLAEAAHRDVPAVHADGFRFVGLLDAFRVCGFHLEKRHKRSIQTAFRSAIERLPVGTHSAADQVVATLRDREPLQHALHTLGSSLDVQGAFRAAANVYLVAYELALHRCNGSAGIDAARGAGRAFRRDGNLGESLRWYELAARIAEFEQDWGRLALALDGAGNTHRHRGSFPKARDQYERAWTFAVLSRDPAAMGNVATSLAVVDRWAGDLEAASRWAWTAATKAPDADARSRAMISLGSILREGNDLNGAVAAYHVARRESADLGYRTLAADALAYCAALRGDSVAYERWRAEVRLTRIREPFIRAQIGYFRALSLSALGYPVRARRVLDAVERYARAHRLTQWEVNAGELVPAPQDPPMSTPDEVRQGLRALQVTSP